MSLILKELTLKNFLSIGNNPQSINLNQQGLTLVLGENIDVGGAGSRNGVGKSTIVQGLCYALFGQPLTFIKKDNLINKTNLKGMQVSLDFEVNGKEYRIERGRKPNYIRWFVNDKKVDSPDNDEAQGESKWTQHEIEKVIGFNHDVFTHVVVLSTEVIPFLKLGAKDQRTIIEQLLGITQLSEKAEFLKNYIKDTKELIRDEEIRIKSILESNEKIQRTINDLQFKSNAWDKDHLKNVEKIEKALADLEKVDIDAEIEAHKNVASWTELNRTIKQLERERGNSEKRIIEQSTVLEKVISDLAKAMEHNCPTCGQHVHDDKIDSIQTSLKNREDEINAVIVALGTELEDLDREIAPLKDALKELGGQPETFYDTLDQAYQHRASVERLLSSLEREKQLNNPYAEQIATLQSSGLQEANYDNINEMTRLKDHQEFLLKLLTSKDSFIRKKIIDQNLLYMNHRLSHYLEKLNLPHEVRFLNDLNVEITLLGREYDFEQLSTGERKRVILGLNWAFRDVWESLNQPLNLIFVDEILDSGMDPQGVESSLENLNKYVRDRGKSVFLISHREELLARVGRILLVQKENGFTSFNANVDKDEINA
jgi:DNA repair exonuclease SbcCD ATPase subunit